jgi:apolipoprotein N-acyltransferase
MMRFAAPATAFAVGALAVLGYAPLEFFPLPIVALAVLAWLGARAANARAAAVLGFAFGFGLFACGIGWIYVALHVYGAMPAALAALATAVLAAYMALYPALALYVAARLGPRGWWIAFPACWMLAEWLRGWFFTGFPWLAVGYSQVPWSPVAGFAPVLGVYGVTLVVAVIAAGVAGASTVSGPGGWKRTSAGLVALVLLGAGLSFVPWTRPAGAPIEVSLVQGNIPQEIKFREDRLIKTLVSFEELVARTRSPLVILPETALPLLLHEVPAPYLERLADHARGNGGDLLVGVFQNDPVGSDRYFNAVVNIGTAPRQSYRKHHLVPFGEFIPLKALLAPVINGWLHIPLSDQTRGDARQQPLAVAGQQVAVNICYEDVFGEEIIRQLPQATLLVNVTNDAWYGESWASVQHLQISQMRALETGRVMLRATNTGVTAAIDHRGNVLARLPNHTVGVLEVRIQGTDGLTPYARVGNAAPVALMLVLLAASVLPAGRSSGRAGPGLRTTGNG